ncbi:glycosyltransferase [Acidovorax sp.]|uniref:glycosyltransferase n=1 Tax=Acidovorax sp. TaxID=1872122 RepID=UPI003BAED436
MKILLLSPFPYGSASGHGGATACLNALRELVKKHRVAVLCFRTNSEVDNSALIEMSALADSVQAININVNKSVVIKAKIKSLLTDTPEHVFYFESPGFRAALRQLILSFKPEIVIAQFPQMAQYLRFCNAVPTVQDVQDAFSVSWYRRAIAAPRGVAKLYAFKQWRNWVAYESKYYKLAQQCWTLSDQDRYGLTVFNPQLATSTVGVPLTQHFELNRRSASSIRVGFIASFGHPPNREALAYFLNEIVTRVNARTATVEFVIAGRAPSESLMQMAPANTKFIGFVDSLQDFYDSCAVIVAPLLSGGGVKIKVAEALCYGKAIVTTPVGAEGIPIENGVHALIESDPDKFANAVCHLLAAPKYREQLEDAALLVAQNSFSTGAWFDRVNRQLDQLIGNQSQVGAND